MRKTLNLRLHSIRLDPPLDSSGEVVVFCELLLPRPGIRARSNVKQVKLRKGRASLAKAPLHEAGILKEDVEGPYGLRVALSRPGANSPIAGIVQAVLAEGIEGAGSFLASAGGLAAIRPAIREPFAQLADSIRDEDYLVMDGGVDLDGDGLADGRIEIPLKLNRSLRLREGAARRGKSRKPEDVTRIRKGTRIGAAILTAQLHD